MDFSEVTVNSLIEQINQSINFSEVAFSISKKNTLRVRPPLVRPEPFCAREPSNPLCLAVALLPH
jgi:hypothetical protein